MRNNLVSFPFIEPPHAERSKKLGSVSERWAHLQFQQCPPVYSHQLSKPLPTEGSQKLVRIVSQG